MKYIFCVLALCCALTSATAQTGIGLRAGANFASQDWDIEDLRVNKESIVGYNAALFFVLGSGPLSLQPELRITRRGTDVTLTDPADPEFRQVIESQIDYVELPVLARLLLDLNSGLKFYLVAGPVIGTATGGTEKTFTTTAMGTIPDENDLEDANYKDFDFGLDVGAGVIIELVGLNIVGDIRYYHGFNDISADEDGKVGVSISNQGIGISAGLFFPFGG